MVIQADTKVVRKYFDTQTKQTYEIELTARDAVLFDLLEKLERALLKRNGE